MPDLHISDFLDKLIYLENAIGHNTSYEVLQPFDFDPRKPSELQSAAKRIAGFLKLDHLVFIISFSKQDDNIGGHIELQDDSQDVFIEISPEMREFPHSVLATLSHEISHKFLHTHRLYTSYEKNDELDNEVLTDISAVYLGLGKLMMNGCEVSKRSTVGNETRTHTYRSGYLTQNQFSFVYKMVSSMRGISHKDSVSALTHEARVNYDYHLKPYKQFFNASFGKENPPPAPSDKSVKPVLETAEEIENVINEVEDVLDRYVKAHILKVRQKVKEVESLNTSPQEVFNPSLRYLLGARNELSGDTLQSKLLKVNRDSERHLANLKRALRALQRSQSLKSKWRFW